MRALQLVDDRKLEITDLPEPDAPGPGEVTLRVKAVALNHIDVWGWRGMAFAKRKMPLVIGAEASGVVDQIGPGVSNVLPGQLVSIYGARTCGLCRPCREGRDNLCEHVGGVHGFHLDGFAQEKVNLPARLLVPAPPGVDAIGAAVAPVTFGTVEHMLFDNAKLEPGETILIHAGGSGIGSAAIQLAKKIGCTVITTVGSDDKIEKAKALGADHVINYRKDRFEGVTRKLTKKKGVDVVFEHVGKDTFAASMFVLKRGGRLVTCGSTSGVSTDVNLMMLFQQQLKLLRLLRLPHGEHGRCHAEDGARPRSSRHRHRSRFLRDRQGAGTHGNPPGLRQNHPADGLKTVRMLITRLVLTAERFRQWSIAQFVFLLSAR
jgi:alcohol dehydrogenase